MRQGGQFFHHTMRREYRNCLGSLAKLRIKLEVSVMQRNESLNDRQAKACTLLGTLDGN